MAFPAVELDHDEKRKSIRGKIARKLFSALVYMLILFFIYFLFIIVSKELRSFKTADKIYYTLKTG